MKIKCKICKARNVNFITKLQKHEKLVKNMAPVSGQDFLWYMIDFANDTLFSGYEPREFESEDLPEIRKMALKYGLRPTDGDPVNDDLQKMIDAADEAKRRAKNENQKRFIR